MKERKCSKCGHSISIYNPAPICYSCQKNIADRKWTELDNSLYKDAKGIEYLDVDDVAYIMDVNAETVRRWYREGRLPPPSSLARRKLRWDKEYFFDWIKSQHRVPPALGRQMEAIIKAHGGLHLDEIAGDYKLGDKESFQVAVYSRDKEGKIVRETVVISTVIPGHYDT